MEKCNDKIINYELEHGSIKGNGDISNVNVKTECEKVIFHSLKEDYAESYYAIYPEIIPEAYIVRLIMESCANDDEIILMVSDDGVGMSEERIQEIMEGKAVLFKEFGNVNAVPICLDTQDTEEIIKAVTWLAPGFGGINLEDISAPRCFEIERRLKEICDIPVFHDDQHGTAVVVAAAMLNALKVVKKDIASVRVVINGAGSAGVAIGKHLLNLGVKDLILVDRFGVICEGMEGLNPAHEEMSHVTNPNHITGTLADAMRGADVFIGVSAPGIVSKEMVASMAKDSIVFPMANPTPEIMPDLAKKAGARIVGTGRSDFPNQINNVLAFPGIFRGALDCRASCINEEMKVATSHALASLISDEELNEENIIAPALDKRVAEVVAKAVIEAAHKTGVARI